MEIAVRALSPVLHKLGELLKDEYNLKKRVRKGVKSLLSELELMHAALLKVGEVPSDQLDVPVRIWSGKVRDLSYDMEDAVDAFMLSVDDGGSSSEPNNMKKKINKFFKKTIKLVSNGRTLHHISDAIQEAQDLAKELAELRKRYELNMCSNSSAATIDTRVIALHKNVSELVGTDRTSGELIKKLIAEDGSPREQLKTISIVGVGGLGKTTLTKVIYEKIKGQFNCAVFVPVGQNPDIRKIFKDILYGLDQHKYRDIHTTIRDENLLIEEIREFLVDKRWINTLHLSPHVVKELSHLTEVRTLTIYCSQTDEDLMNVLIESLGNLHKLQNLRIWDCDKPIDLMREGWMPTPVLRKFESMNFSGKTRYEFLRLPKWINSTSLPLISSLEIGVEELQADDIQIIGMLPALCYLCLEAPHVMGTFVARAGAFPSAKYCRFFDFPTAPCLFQPGTMPRLQFLWFEVPARLVATGEVDCGMGHLPALENVHVQFHDENLSAEEKDTAKDVLRAAAEAHPKRPATYFH